MYQQASGEGSGGGLATLDDPKSPEKPGQLAPGTGTEVT